MMTIFEDVLKIKNIRIEDNFFDIGGNSLLAISVFSKIESAFNIKLSLRIFFDGPRIKDLAEVVDFTIYKSTMRENKFGNQFSNYKRGDIMFNKFLEELDQKSIKISFSEGKIKYEGPEENITPELIEKLKKYKGNLIKYYWPPECANMMPINPSAPKFHLY